MLPSDSFLLSAVLLMSRCGVVVYDLKQSNNNSGTVNKVMEEKFTNLDCQERQALPLSYYIRFIKASEWLANFDELPSEVSSSMIYIDGEDEDLFRVPESVRRRALASCSVDKDTIVLLRCSRTRTCRQIEDASAQLKAQRGNHFEMHKFESCVRALFICRENENKDAPAWKLFAPLTPNWTSINLEPIYSNSATVDEVKWAEFNEFASSVTLTDQLDVEYQDLCLSECRRSLKPSNWSGAPTQTEALCQKHLKCTPRNTSPRSARPWNWWAVVALGVLLGASLLALAVIGRRRRRSSSSSSDTTFLPNPPPQADNGASTMWR